MLDRQNKLLKEKISILPFTVSQKFLHQWFLYCWPCFAETHVQLSCIGKKVNITCRKHYKNCLWHWSFELFFKKSWMTHCFLNLKLYIGLYNEDVFLYKNFWWRQKLRIHQVHLMLWIYTYPSSSFCKCIFFALSLLSPSPPQYCRHFRKIKIK